MHASHRVASSQRFHQICRPLAQGEPLPHLPSLAEQLIAFQADVARERDAALEDEAVNEIWDDEDDDAF